MERAGIEEYGFEGKEIGLYVSFAASPPWLCGIVTLESLESLSRSRHGDAEFIYFIMCSQGGGSVGFCAKKEEEEGGKLCQSSKVRKKCFLFLRWEEEEGERGGEIIRPPRPYHIWFLAQKVDMLNLDSSGFMSI